MKKLGLDSGPGSDGVLPARKASMRVLRQTETESAECLKVLDEWKAFNASGDKAVQNVDSDVNEDEVTKTINALDTLNNRC